MLCILHNQTRPNHFPHMPASTSSAAVCSVAMHAVSSARNAVSAGAPLAGLRHVFHTLSKFDVRNHDPRYPGDVSLHQLSWLRGTGLCCHGKHSVVTFHEPCTALVDVLQQNHEQVLVGVVLKSLSLQSASKQVTCLTDVQIVRTCSFHATYFAPSHTIG
jgi:hypothetical protein